MVMRLTVPAAALTLIAGVGSASATPISFSPSLSNTGTEITIGSSGVISTLETGCNCVIVDLGSISPNSTITSLPVSGGGTLSATDTKSTSGTWSLVDGTVDYSIVAVGVDVGTTTDVYLVSNGTAGTWDTADFPIGSGNKDHNLTNLVFYAENLTPSLQDPPPTQKVPEPLSLTLLGVGIGGIAVARRRRA
jgi:hypothetical protein